MANLDLARYHLGEAFTGAVADSEGDEALARHLNARVKLRLISMSDEDLWELAKLTSCPPQRTVDQVFASHKQAIERHKATAQQWAKYL